MLAAARGFWSKVANSSSTAPPSSALDALLHLLPRERGDVVLQLGELGREVGRDQVAARRQDLPHLDERRPEPLQGMADAHRRRQVLLPAGGLGRGLDHVRREPGVLEAAALQSVEDALLPQHLGDLAVARAAPRPRLGGAARSLGPWTLPQPAARGRRASTASASRPYSPRGAAGGCRPDRQRGAARVGRQVAQKQVATGMKNARLPPPVSGRPRPGPPAVGDPRAREGDPRPTARRQRRGSTTSRAGDRGR